MSIATQASSSGPRENLEILNLINDKDNHQLHSCSVKLSKTRHRFPENGKQALTYICEREADHFRVLFEFEMPVMNGWQFLEECQNRNLRKLNAVVVTISTDSGTAFDCSILPRSLPTVRNLLLRKKYLRYIK